MAHAVHLPLTGGERQSLLKTADARLYPSLRDPNFLVLRSRRFIFEKWIAQLPGDDLSVLDVGGRYQPYRPLFEGRTARYIACDILRTQLVNVVGNGEALPFLRNTFDVVVATQVFDYFSAPREAAEQIHAVLKPGGVLLMSVPSLAPAFADGECWRFTPKGIRATLADFSHLTLVPELSSIGGILRTMNLAADTFARLRLLRALLSVTACPLLNLLGLGLEALKVTHNDQFAPNYSVFAVK
ncbi:MAG TPA: class I SAM-dependent methyltransferase [Terriglobales bacterium]|nr:class I SAM-dependent methyltransferase [Terriglobales bacterium]